jgi:FkbH-like protein
MPAVRLVISASFTAELLREPLEYLFQLLGWDASVVFAPFAQVHQTLLDPHGPFAVHGSGDFARVNVMLVRAGDCGEAEELAAALRSSFENHGARLIVGVTPPNGNNLEAELRTRWTGGSYVDTALYPVEEIYDPHAEALGAIPYTAEYFASLALSILREVHRLHATPVKVIALDCDDTLWSGVCGEDGPLGVVVDPPRRRLQEFMAQQRARGRVLALASKNNETDVVETFRAHPDMPLRLADFVARRVNWEPKSVGLEAIASELRLGLDSFVFIDDNPMEAAEVRAEWPEVAAIALPPIADEIPEFLRHVWVFDDAAIAVTGEDQRRTEAYAEQAQRADWERQARNLDEFIAGLKLEIAFREIRPEHLPRAAQLTQRTNQMNTTTRRRTEAEVAAFLREGSGFVVEVRDRFGDYGIVGLVLFTEERGETEVDTFLLSCRALGRGVEHAMLRRLGERADTVHVRFAGTARNAPAYRFLKSVRKSAGDEPFRFRGVDLAGLRYEAGKSLPHDVEPVPPTAPQSRRAPDYTAIAQLRAPADLLAAIRRGKMTPHTAHGQPRTDLERRLCVLWAELLAVAEVGIHDNFFDLGGHSLLAVQLASRLHQDLGVDLPLEVVYTGTLTVAELAHSIELFEVGHADDPEYAALLAEIENLTEEEAQRMLENELRG